MLSQIYLWLILISLHLLRDKCVSNMLQNHSVSHSSPQQELEGIWNNLQMPNCLKLDMALKYSSNKFFPVLPNVGAACLLFCYHVILRRARLCHSMSSVCPFVCLWRSGTVISDHIGWNTSKIISWPISLRYLLIFTWAIWSNENIPKIRWNRGGITKTCNISETMQDRTKVNIYDRLIGSRIHAFDWYQSQWLWMTLISQNVTLAPPEKTLNEDRLILSVAKCRPMILVSWNTRYMRIFTGVPSGRGHQVQ